MRAALGWLRTRAGVAFATLGLLGVMALAVFPARAYVDQRRLRADLAAEEAGLRARNQALEARIAELGTDAEIERLARQYNLVKPGEEAYFVEPRSTPPDPAPPPAPEPERRSPSLWDRITSIF